MAKPAPGTPIDSSHPLAASLLEFWPMEGATADSTTGAVSGIVMTRASGSSTYTTGVYGPAIQWSNTNERWVTPTTPSLRPTGAQSIAVGITTPAVFATNNAYGMVLGSISGSSRQMGLILGYNAAANSRWVLEVAGVRRDYVLPVLSPNTLYNVVVTRNSGGAINAYFNGSLNLSHAGHAGAITATHTTLGVGGWDGGHLSQPHQQHYAAIWDRELTAAEAAELSADPFAMFQVAPSTIIRRNAFGEPIYATGVKRNAFGEPVLAGRWE